METDKREINGLVLVSPNGMNSAAIANSINICTKLLDKNTPFNELKAHIPFIEVSTVALYTYAIESDYFYILDNSNKTMGICEIMFFENDTRRIYINDIQMVSLDTITFQKILTKYLPSQF